MNVVLKVLSIVRAMSVGIVVTAVVVLGTALYVAYFGPLYDVWGWPELVLGGLILAACAMAGMEMALRQPNPYSRTNPLYNLRDVPPDRNLESGGSGWLVQSIPLALTAVVLAGFFWIT